MFITFLAVDALFFT